MRGIGWVAAIVICLAAVILSMRHHLGQAASPLPGNRAPAIALSTLNGEHVNLADEKGKVVVADFWATWCPTCQGSLPHIQKLATNAKWARQGLVVWAINVQEPADTVAMFLKANNYTFTVLLDPTGSASANYASSGIPTTAIIGRDGLVKNVFIDFEGQETTDAIDEAVQSALGQAAN